MSMVRSSELKPLWSCLFDYKNWEICTRSWYDQCDQMDIFSIFGHLPTTKNACELFIFCQSGKLSSNMVTLHQTHFEFDPLHLCQKKKMHQLEQQPEWISYIFTFLENVSGFLRISFHAIFDVKNGNIFSSETFFFLK